MKKAISARIDEDTLKKLKDYGTNINGLINTLVKRWIHEVEKKQLLLFQEETGQNELSQMKAKENFRCRQCCNNCIHISQEKTKCYKTGIIYHPGDHININKFTCIYWEKKKGSN